VESGETGKKLLNILNILNLRSIIHQVVESFSIVRNTTFIRKIED